MLKARRLKSLGVREASTYLLIGDDLTLCDVSCARIGEKARGAKKTVPRHAIRLRAAAQIPARREDTRCSDYLVEASGPAPVISYWRSAC
jgi:hypothetical protein